MNSKVRVEESLASKIGLVLSQLSFHPANSLFDALSLPDLGSYWDSSIGVLMGEEYGVMEGGRFLGFRFGKSRRKALGLIITEPIPRLQDISLENWVFEVLHGEYMDEARALAETLSARFSASIRVRLVTGRFAYERLAGDGSY